LIPGCTGEVIDNTSAEVGRTGLKADSQDSVVNGK
jgi:hypothetical protein